MTRLTAVCAIVVTAFSAAPVWAQALQVVVDAEGRLLNAPASPDRQIRSVEIRVVGALVTDTFEVRFRPLATPDNTALPALTDTLASGSGTAFTIPVPVPNPDYLLYSVVQRSVVLTATAREELTAQLAKTREELKKAHAAVAATTAQAAVDKAQAERDDAEDRQDEIEEEAKLQTARLENEIAATAEDIKAFGQRETPEAIAEIIRLQAQLRTLRQALGTLQDRVQSAQKALTVADDVLDLATTTLEETAEARAAAAIASRENTYSNRLTAAERLSLRRVGILVLRRDARPVYYRLTAGSRERTLAMERVAPVPQVTTENEWVAVIVNRRRVDFPEPFTLTYTTAVKEVENPTPVRPVFAPKGEAGVAEQFVDLDRAYTDFVMPFGRRFPANTVVSVSVSTYMRVITKDETTVTTNDPPGEKEARSKTTTTDTRSSQRVALVSNEEYPPIRGLYRFNFTAGVNGSSLRSPSFVRIKTALDDPATSADETRYKTEEVKGDPVAMPVFGLTVYTRPVDIQAPVGWYERLIPAPTIGFAFQNPHENIFVGASHEIARNVQAWWGIHLGKVNKLQTTAGIDDPASADAPAVDKRFDAAPYFGIAFNLNVIKTVFGAK